MTRRALLDWLALGLLVLAVAAAGKPMVDESLRRVRQARRRAGETSLDARRRLFGTAYIDAVERIRDELDPDEPYLLVEGGERAEGNALWLRYQLAPRPASFLGQIDEIWDAGQVRRRLPGKVHWVIVAQSQTRPPQLIPRHDFLRWLERRDGD